MAAGRDFGRALDLCEEAARRHEEGRGIRRRKTGGQTLQTASSPTSSAQSSGQGAAPQPSLKEAGKKAEIPVVYVAFGPTELLETRGDPVFKPIPGTGLEYAENTNGNFFRLNGQYYVLISGRWFKAASWQGPWTFVTAADMPPDFAKIPVDSPKATVLASVPGTPQVTRRLDRQLDPADRDHHPLGSEADGGV